MVVQEGKQYSFDISKPNPARIYDYLLDGNHNFPADRVAAERVIQLVPGIKKQVRLNRWFLMNAAEELAKQQFAGYLDLATGLPSQGYIHDLLPSTTPILYNDLDPAVITFAEDLIKDRPNVRFIQSDMRDTDAILSYAEDFFQGQRRIGICMVGVAYFIEDATLQAILHRLYEWCAPGSRLAISLICVEQIDKAFQEGIEMYRNMGSPLYPRTRQACYDITAPWTPVGAGLQPLRKLIRDIPGDIEIEQTQSREEGLGGIFEKP